MSEPQKSNHTDLYEIEAHIDEITVQLKNAGLNPNGLLSLLNPNPAQRKIILTITCAPTCLFKFFTNNSRPIINS